MYLLNLDIPNIPISVIGVPSQKPKEQQRSVLRPAVLQAPPSKSHIESSEYILHFDCIKQ